MAGRNAEKTGKGAAGAKKGGAPAALRRELRLEPEDAWVPSWRELPPLRRPPSPSFDRTRALELLRGLGKAEGSLVYWDGTPWRYDWRKVAIPRRPSRDEAFFWVAAVAGLTSREPAAVADALALGDDALPAPRGAELARLLCWSLLIPNFAACIATAMTPSDFLFSPDDPSGTEGALYDDHVALFREFHLPFLSAAGRAGLDRELGSLPVFVPAHHRERWPLKYAIGAALGRPAEIAAVLAAIPDLHYDRSRHGPHCDYHQRPQWLVFGLADARQVEAEFRRLGLTLRDEPQIRAWLALTGLEALDAVGAAVCAQEHKEHAAELAKSLERVIAPEAAPVALEIRLRSKAPLSGLRWLNDHPREAAVGLAPVAMGGSGKLAEAARDHLRVLAAGHGRAVLEAAAGDLPEETRAWLEAEILGADAELPPLRSPAELPAELAAALTAHAPPKSWPPWLQPAALPALAVGRGRLAPREVGGLLALLRASPLGASSPQIAAVRAAIGLHPLETFAWKLFELWLGLEAPPKDKWAFGALGHLGGDGIVLKLASLLRAWPGEGQHQRAVLGLDVLRAIGSDAALMALNGLAEKVKFKGLQQKAQAQIEEIAKGRGLSRDQLADRVVPDAGLDERGGRLFDFGPRQFRVVFGSGLQPQIRDAEGQLRADLPKPTKADDPAKAKAALADWKLLKQTLKEVLKVQADRLEDAMIAGRRWSAEEFPRLFVCHPLMVHLARQLIFAAYDAEGRAAATFRVTEDHTLADAEDAEVALPALPIGIVHPAHLGEPLRAAWTRVQADYQILPPFQQLSRTLFLPEEAELECEDLDRFRGRWVPGITFYGMLDRSKWQRLGLGGASRYRHHAKYFPSAGLTALLEYGPGFTASFVDQPQQLERIFFVRGSVPLEDSEGFAKLKIGAVDRVVSSETLRFASALAAKAE